VSSKVWPAQRSSWWRTGRAGDRHGKSGKYGRERDEINPVGFLCSDEDSPGREYNCRIVIVPVGLPQKSRPGFNKFSSRPGVQGIVPTGTCAGWHILVPTGYKFQRSTPLTCMHFIVCKHGRGRSLDGSFSVPASTYCSYVQYEKKRRDPSRGLPSKTSWIPTGIILWQTCTVGTWYSCPTNEGGKFVDCIKP